MARACPATSATSASRGIASSRSAGRWPRPRGSSTPTGKVVTPGFIDPHTHYDAQICFDPYAYPAIEHGITSVVTGNCSLSLAPVPAPLTATASRACSGSSRRCPRPRSTQGVDWRWGESFGGMLDARRGDLALNVAPLVGHSVLRLAVLGDDVRRPATAEEVAAMCDLLRECLEAGAVGMSTSYVDIEEDFNPVPCRWAEHSEVEALCAVLGEHGRMLQIVHEFFDAGLTVSRVEMLGKLSREHGIPTTLSPIFHSKAVPDACDKVMAAVEREWAAGGRVWPQVQTRPIDISWTLDQRSIMFLAHSRLVACALAADQGTEARRVRGSAEARGAHGHDQHAREHPQRRPRPERLRRPRGRARAQPRPGGAHARRHLERAQRHTG